MIWPRLTKAYVLIKLGSIETEIDLMIYPALLHPFTYDGSIGNASYCTTRLKLYRCKDRNPIFQFLILTFILYHFASYQ